MLAHFPYKVLLASQSPRRRELLSGLDIPFDVFVKKNIDESYPEHLDIAKIPVFLSEKKAKVYRKDMNESTLIITADTIVVKNHHILEKPKDKALATAMLQSLSGHVHRVITGVTLSTKAQQHSFSTTTEVYFAHLSLEEINYYIEHYRPYDKAGSYGIQEWLGFIAVERINGCYFNVMGLPVHRLYCELKQMKSVRR